LALRSGSAAGARRVREQVLRRALLLVVSGVLAAGAACQHAPQPAEQATAPAVAPVLEPKAIDLLKAASARLAAARTLTFTAVISYEIPSRFGPPLVHTTKSEVAMQRPDKLRVLTPGDGPALEFYYDGKTMMAFEPAENFVAVAPAPPHDRRRAGGRLPLGCDLLPVRRRDRGRPL
jgi:hypothetical protein